MNERIKGELLMQPSYQLTEEEIQELAHLTVRMLHIKSQNHIVPVPDGLLERLNAQVKTGVISLSQINLAFEFISSCIDSMRSFAKTENYEDCYYFAMDALDYLNILNTVYLRGSKADV